MILAAIQNEPVGQGDATSLVYINYKAPDYAGHKWNMLDGSQAVILRAVDDEVGRLRSLLDERFGDGGYVLIVTADHGQSPLPDATGGARVDPIQLKASLEREFGPGFFDLVLDVKPSEVYLHDDRLWEYGVAADDVAAFLRDYRYGDNVGSYVPGDAVDRRRLDDRLFAAVLPQAYIGSLDPAFVEGAGAGVYAWEDPGMPPVTWR
jgi:hypothetical protein